MGFILKIKTDNTGVSTDTEFTIPTNISRTYSYDVQWEEDGNAANNGSTGVLTEETTITFPSAGTYLVEINGTFPHLFFNEGGDCLKVLDFQFDGSIAWESMEDAFSGCNNIENVLSAGIPNLSGVTSFRRIFRNSSFNQDINDWNVSNVEDFLDAFRLTPFNSNISTWDVSSATSMATMFFQSDFNGDISEWDVVNVETFTDMFTLSSFNGDISKWDVRKATNFSRMFRLNTSFNQDISDWDMSGAEDISSMFESAVAFNQDISNWNVLSVADFSSVFENASSFNQDISSWDITSATALTDIFTGSGLSSENYSRVLIGWANQVSNNANTPAGLALGAGTITYIDGTLVGKTPYDNAVDAHNYLTGVSPDPAWTITDGGSVVGAFDIYQGLLSYEDGPNAGQPVEGAKVLYFEADDDALTNLALVEEIVTGADGVHTTNRTVPSGKVLAFATHYKDDTGNGINYYSSPIEIVNSSL